MESFAGKTAVVTGGGSGIGAALGRALGAEGMAVVVADVDPARATSIAEELGATGATAEGYAVDVADPDAVEALAEHVFQRFGGCHLLCNNAGVAPLGVTWAGTPQQWDWVIGVNLLGVVNGVRSFVPRMIDQGGGHILNTASLAALRSVPVTGIYNASKHAVLGLTENLRVELAPHRIGVTALCPGAVSTNIGESGNRMPGSAPTGEEMAALHQALVAGVEPAHYTPVEAERVAELALEGIRRNEPYVITAPGARPAVEARVAEILAAFDSARARGEDLP